MVNRKLHHGPFHPWPPSAADITRGVSENNQAPLVCTGYLCLSIFNISLPCGMQAYRQETSDWRMIIK